MTNIKDLDIYKIKKCFFFIIILLMIFFSTYKLIILPYMKLQSLNNDIKNNSNKIGKLKDEDIMIKKTLENAQKKKIENKKNWEYLVTNFTNMSFKHLGDFENHINELIIDNNLTLNTIGRMEIIKIDEIEKIWKINCPYEILGPKENIKTFLSQLEKSQIFINISSAPISFDKASDPAKLTLKISANILQEAKPIVENNNSEKDKLFSLNKIMKNVQSYNIILLNNIQYIIIHMKNKGKSIFKENENIEIDNKKYKIKVISKKLYLESI